MAWALLRWWGGLETQTRWLCMLYGPWLLGLFICLGNHFSFAALHDQDVALYDRTLIAALKNIWPLAVRGCMVASATTAFVPILWSSLPNKSLPVGVVDSVLQLPALAPALKITFSGSLRDLLVPILATLNVLTYAIITIAPPAALVVDSMYDKPTKMSVPRPDFSRNSTHFAMLREGSWSYERPDGYLIESVSNILRLERFVLWEPPSGCGSSCLYNVSYDAPVLKCNDYDPGEPIIEVFTNHSSTTIYQGYFNMTDDYLTLDVAVWPGPGAAPVGDGLNWTTSPVATRCAFYTGTQTMSVSYKSNQHIVSIANWTALSPSPVPGPSLGILNTTSCYLHPDIAGIELLDIDGPQADCADTRIQLNTWALIDAFARQLVGRMYADPVEAEMTSAWGDPFTLRPSGIFRLHGYHFFSFVPFTIEGRIRGLGYTLEYLFAKSTLLLTHYSRYHNLNVDVDAHAAPFENRYVYSPRFLWSAYAVALITVIVPCLLACFYISKGFVLTDKTRLSRVLTATRSDAFNVIKGMSDGSIDDMVIRYQQVQAINDSDNRMEFTVMLKGGQPKDKKPGAWEEEMYLLPRP